MKVKIYEISRNFHLSTLRTWSIRFEKLQRGLFFERIVFSLIIRPCSHYHTAHDRQKFTSPISIFVYENNTMTWRCKYAYIQNQTFHEIYYASAPCRYIAYMIVVSKYFNLLWRLSHCLVIHRVNWHIRQPVYQRGMRHCRWIYNHSWLSIIDIISIVERIRCRLRVILLWYQTLLFVNLYSINIQRIN